MLVLSIGIFFRGFNASRCIMYLSILAFTVLLVLRLDDAINISYFLVFTPLFACNFIVFLGALIGIISFIIRPPQQSEASLRVDFVAMLLTTLQHAVLLAFEVLLARNIDLHVAGIEKLRPLSPWSIIFGPLLIECCLAIVVSIWAVRHDKSFEFELFFSVNVVQFVFIAFKLDRHVDWSWAVVFIPLWVVLSLSVVGVLYALILALLLTRSRHLLPANRRNHIYGAILQTLLVVPALVTLILLTGKLDAANHPGQSVADLSYLMIFLPLMCSLVCLLLMSICSRGGNVWWFALRRPFCTFLLDTCPCLRQYANVSYKVGVREEEEEEGDPPPLLDDIDCRQLRPVLPITSIESPD